MHVRGCVGTDRGQHCGWTTAGTHGVLGLERSLSAHRMRPSALSLLGTVPQGDQAQGLISARDRGSMSSPLRTSRLIEKDGMLSPGPRSTGAELCWVSPFTSPSRTAEGGLSVPDLIHRRLQAAALSVVGLSHVWFTA